MLEDPRTTGGLHPVGAILPKLEQWSSRPWGGLVFHATQIIIGHGCFGHYLCYIGSEPNSDCHHCGSRDDTAQHTLKFCPAWAEQRVVLVVAIGDDLSFSAIIVATLASEKSWKAFYSFVTSECHRRRRPRRRGKARVDIVLAWPTEELRELVEAGREAALPIEGRGKLGREGEVLPFPPEPRDNTGAGEGYVLLPLPIEGTGEIDGGS